MTFQKCEIESLLQLNNKKPWILSIENKKKREVNNMLEIFLYLYFFVGAIFLDDLGTETTTNGYKIVPKRTSDAMQIVLELLWEREATITVRNRGYIEILIEDSGMQYIEYLKDDYEVKISECRYIPKRKPNLFLSLPPRYFLRLRASFLLDFLRYSVLGDTLSIETKLHRSSLKDIILLGKKRYQQCFDVAVYTPFLLRQYASFGTLQELILENGYKLVLTAEEIQSLVWGDGSWISGQLKPARK